MIISTTLAGPGSEKTLARALDSIIDHVDRCLVILPPGGRRLLPWETLSPKLVLREWEWQNDFGAARNAALDFARQLGASWSVTTDADEWWTGADELRPTLAASITPQCWYCFDGDMQYLQPRAIRSPCMRRWEGRTHESLEIHGPRLQRARFHEDPKTPEQEKTKARRDEQMLLQSIREQPRSGRWWYYLGECSITLGRYEEAVERLVKAAQLSNVGELGAWACFRAGEVMSTELDRQPDAVELFAAGLARHAGIPELCWGAALACARMNAYAQAIHWCRLAEVHGERGADQAAALAHRVLWRRPHALREGPAELRAAVLRAMGDEARAVAADAEAAAWRATAAAMS